MSRHSPTSTPTPPTPPSSVSLDPVTGAVLTTPKACCSSPSHLHPATVSTHTASDVYLTTLYSLLGVAVAAGVGYAGYRYYTDVYSKKSTAPSKEGIVDKRAAYPVKEVTDERLIDAAIAEAQGQKLFVLVEGARDSTTGLSWCGDCVTADPIIERVFSEEKANLSLIRAPVQRGAYKGNAAHPYRSHPELQLQRIPTLYKMGPRQTVVDQLIETELHDIERVRKFVRA